MYHRISAWRDGVLARRHLARSDYAPMLAEVPAGLLPHWKRTAGIEFQGLPRSAAFYARSLEGLLVFFDCVRIAQAHCALPSRAVDSVWHAWLALDPAGLGRFCVRHFGQPIPHHPAGTMPGEPDMALAACLVAARRRQGQSPAGPALPLLFKLDEALRMPLGYSHHAAHGRICCGRLGFRGQPSEPRRYPERLTPNGLLLAGLVSAEEAELAMRRPGWHGPATDMIDSSIDADVGGDAGDGDGEGGGDSGGDGGGAGDSGGDGGGCGGGCGGGGD